MEIAQQDHRQAADPDFANCCQCARKNRALCQISLVVLPFVGLILILVLVPLHFDYVERGELALKENSLENEVDLSRVYTMGTYGIGPGADFRKFPAEQQTEHQVLEVFADGQVEFPVEVDYYWQIIPEQLTDLFRLFPSSYASQVGARANTAIKSVSTEFSVEEYKTSRATIRDRFRRALQERLPELHMRMGDHLFFLTNVSLPERVIIQDITRAVQEQDNIREQNRQQELLVRQETERQRQDILGNITVAQRSGTAQRAAIIASANAQGEQIRAEGNNRGLNAFLVAINASDSVSRIAYIRYWAEREAFEASLSS